MHVQLSHSQDGRISAEIAVDPSSRLVYIERSDGPMIALKFKTDRASSAWHYQSLMWSCRGGKPRYFRALVSLYRALRREKLTEHSLRYLSWAENRLRNGTFATGTPSFAQWRIARAVPAI